MGPPVPGNTSSGKGLSMNNRQRAKKAARKINPIQEAWNVVAEHLVSLDISCFFVDKSRWDSLQWTLHDAHDRYTLVSQPLRRPVK